MEGRSRGQALNDVSLRRVQFVQPRINLPLRKVRGAGDYSNAMSPLDPIAGPLIDP